MTTTGQKNTQNYTEGQWGTVIPFDQISQPGCYICNWTGHLLRIPEDAIAQGRSPLMNIVGSEPLYVTKIADNPYIPVTKARMLAANFDLAVEF